MTTTNDSSDAITYFNRRAGTLLQEPGEQDVLLKKPAGHHKGNQRLLEDTEEFRERYKLATTLSEKKELAHQVLLRVKERGGLFLMYTPPQTSNSANATDDSCWCIQNYEESSLRVRQILREATGGKTKVAKANYPPNHVPGAVKNTTTLPGSLITPRMPRGNHLPQQHSHYSSEYLEACKVLSDDTMNQACELLLNTSNNPQDAKEQLLQIYQKCVQAASVIETELQNNPTTAAFPLPPVLRGRTGSLGMTSATNNSTIPKIKTVIPPVNRTQRMTHPSDYPHRGSMGSTSSSIHGAKGLPPSKKMRRAPSPPPATSAVPESALQFLAKLNKEHDANHNIDSGDMQKKKPKKKNGEESDSQSTRNSEDMEQEQEQIKETKQETSAPAVRVQPKRGSKTN